MKSIKFFIIIVIIFSTTSCAVVKQSFVQPEKKEVSEKTCDTPLAFNDKNNTSVDCIVGSYTPEKAIALAESLNGKPVEIGGIISMEAMAVEEQPGGPVAMPTAGYAFHTSEANIYMNGAGGVNTVDRKTEVKIRGVFNYDPTQKEKGIYGSTYSLTIPIYCTNCVSK